MNTNVARRWLDDIERAANDKDYTGYLDLISRQFHCYGPTADETVDYERRAEGCRRDFSAGYPKRLAHDGLRIIATTPVRIRFTTRETVEAPDGAVASAGLEVILQQEDDGKWRAVEERRRAGG